MARSSPKLVKLVPVAVQTVPQSLLFPLPLGEKWARVYDARERKGEQGMEEGATAGRLDHPVLRAVMSLKMKMAPGEEGYP
jgi:hypothetical protein